MTASWREMHLRPAREVVGEINTSYIVVPWRRLWAQVSQVISRKCLLVVGSVRCQISQDLVTFVALWARVGTIVARKATPEFLLRKGTQKSGVA